MRSINRTGQDALGRPLILWFSLALAAAFCVALVSGRVPIHIADILEMIARQASGGQASGDTLSKELVFLWIRLPRCLMAVMVGAGLAVSGGVYQALFRNPLVSPDILGVSAGCTFGAALGLLLSIDLFGLVHGLSFIFGLLAVSMSIGLARAISIKPVIVLVLSGMVVLSFFNALLMIIKYFSDPYDELPSIVFWVMGSLNRVTWQSVSMVCPFVLAGLFLFVFLSFRLNILSLGDIQAKSLGMNPSIVRAILIVASSFMVAASVATCGQISWVGLVVPHIARTISGPEHGRMIPLTALLGALFLLVADTGARSLSTTEIPVGIITALVGAPVFGYVMFKNRRTGWL